MTFVLCVSDWPYTLLGPISVESVMYSEGSDARVFWSADGSVIAVRKPGSYVAAYDYRAHQLIRYAGVGGDYWAAENFRVLHKAPLNYSMEDLDADRRAADVLSGR